MLVSREQRALARGRQLEFPRKQGGGGHSRQRARACAKAEVLGRARTVYGTHTFPYGWSRGEALGQSCRASDPRSRVIESHGRTASRDVVVSELHVSQCRGKMLRKKLDAQSWTNGHDHYELNQKF